MPQYLESGFLFLKPCGLTLFNRSTWHVLVLLILRVSHHSCQCDYIPVLCNTLAGGATREVTAVKINAVCYRWTGNTDLGQVTPAPPSLPCEKDQKESESFLRGRSWQTL